VVYSKLNTIKYPSRYLFLQFKTASANRQVTDLKILFISFRKVGVANFKMIGLVRTEIQTESTFPGIDVAGFENYAR